ncbi:hypothetical protein [Fimbriiglobus ruber]|uniref:hypothetical protein n=1 Tax=Fimbriiglobus ruber TaxID=1908690 RepID=UPI001179A7F1|nr:hypothetical protein [Fimbriiglobus ruber]
MTGKPIENLDTCRRAFEEWIESLPDGAFRQRTDVRELFAWQAWRAAWKTRPKPDCATPTENDFLADVVVKRIQAWEKSDHTATGLRCEMAYLLKAIDDPHQFKLHYSEWLRTAGQTWADSRRRG